MTRTIMIPGVGAYLPRGLKDTEHALAIAKLIAEDPVRALSRDPHPGHCTASAFIVNPARDRVLLMHHTKLDRWLQPGGHCDGDGDFLRVARKEAFEETGITDLRPCGTDPFHVDVHEIPARAAVPGHLHFDVRFLFEADNSQALCGNSESLSLAWVHHADLPGLAPDLVEALIPAFGR